jgi:hypothetical protein
MLFTWWISAQWSAILGRTSMAPAVLYLSHGTPILDMTRTSGAPLWLENKPSSLLDPVRVAWVC